MSVGCAYMFNGGYQNVSINTLPTDADIKNNGNYLGTGATIVALDRNANQNISVSKDKYETAHVYLPKKINAAWMLLDITTCVVPIFLCIPVLVDAVSGSWNHYDENVSVKLEKSKPE